MTEKQYPELPEPFGWLSHNVLTRKTFFGNMPLQSLQPGVYKHIKAYTRSQVIEAIDADRAMREPTRPSSGYVMVPSSGEPVAWKHDCAALLTNDVELWIDTCPHCGKPQEAAPYDHGPQAATIEEATRDVGKWLNERPNRPLDLRHVAMLVHHAQAAPSQDAEAVNKELLRCLIDCVEDSEECLQRHLDSYGETYKPQRVAAMRKCISDAKAAIDAARAQQEKL